MPRLERLSNDEMTAAQSEVSAETIAGKRGRVPAPMIAWLRNPELARRAQRLGELLRYDTTLNPRLFELAILVCARHWTSHHEWTAHKRLALEAGLSPHVIADVAARRPPEMAGEEDRLVHDIALCLLSTGRISRALYDRGVQSLEERGMVELVAIVGYYCLVSVTLNAFELGIPESIATELDDPDFPSPAPAP
ncbi:MULTISPECIES: carboxymuconolactone decarboxylase family protein [unclassified Mesorhizobium]|uniref:carboxymuconolactone decarboxylase family protein n=1 Tax=unclassified Mesorhizobium TaxID=325217 RepID=UPI000FDAABB1|nr:MULTISPECIES: carboxymuconolactone decarboxylase family protein [unclassified Mesorhizobium]TGR18833.1 carboxymuconolactone decarboxylase family protein [Mesorhizobium sp. M8A.F.Ca.ET.197.01.1.1]TGR37099.1 carboxymuconolactone decarboxylase family protein [bacterium M00.F.Ca.ET.199.01.1.1]TGR41564.1 carboxymuconolactone decarboxylase family protein [Mesorhizobium sp. M8A.F.Ca.ET.198.01.1.1]TGV85274.1 carboxymuconolactone decarboxylase family protein [Mesorhizobium sp. M00.F.Ca.ET.149.01.1.1]